MIHTKMHIVHEILDRKDIDVTVIHLSKGNLEEAQNVVAAMLDAPKYCIAEEVVALLERSDVERSVMAILKAGVARLPFSPMLVEFSPPMGGAPASRYFILLLEGNNPDMIIGYGACLSSHDTELVVINDPIPIGICEDGLIVSTRDKNDTMVWATTVALSLAFLMLNTKGIDKQVIHTGRLNKARAKTRDGRKPVPQHTVVRIGTIYDRSGKGHSATGTGRHMPVHLRAGHTRGQHFGKGNEDLKIIYITPCIVNFSDGDDKPKIPNKEVRI